MGMPVTSKGQVTIPKAVRDRLGVAPGDRVEFAYSATGEVMLRKAEAPAKPPRDRFDRVIGTGTALRGMRTADIMRLLRGDDDA